MTDATNGRRAPSLTPAPLRLVGPVLFTISALGASPQSALVQQQLNQCAAEGASLAWNTRARRRDRFGYLARRWREDTRRLSSTTEISMHPAYQEIIGTGPDALPLILEDLRDNTGHWFWALKAISGEDPVPPRDRGSINRMKAAWLTWGRAKRLI